MWECGLVFFQHHRSNLLAVEATLLLLVLGHCCRLSFVLPNSYVESVTPKMMAFEVDFWENLGLDEVMRMRSAFCDQRSYRRKHQIACSFLSLSLHFLHTWWKSHVRSFVSVRRVLTRHQHHCHLISNFQSPEL